MKDFFEQVSTSFTFDDLYLNQAYSEVDSRLKVDLSSEIIPGLKFKLPILPANMSTISGKSMIEAMVGLGGTAAFHRFMSPEELVNEYSSLSLACQGQVGISVGVNPDWYCPALNFIVHRFQQTPEYLPAYIIVDVAHGYHLKVLETIKHIRDYYPQFANKIIAGNICTGQGALFMAEAGVSGIKVGLGSGGNCSTRLKTGIGRPQLSAVKDVADTIREYNAENNKNIKVISDGGVTDFGDCVKAIAAGADFVMLGGLLSGTDETPGEVITDAQGNRSKLYSGSASIEAQSVFFKMNPDDISPEGISIQVPCKGPVDILVRKMRVAIGSGFSYCGCRNIQELQEYGRMESSWTRVTHAGQIEATPHGGNWNVKKC